MAGKASTIRIDVISVAQEKIGIRISVMPGARRLKTVTIMLKAAARDEKPSTCKPSAQNSMLRASLKFCVAPWRISVLGA